MTYTKSMLSETIHVQNIPISLQQRLLLDAAQRDRTTARRLGLLQILWGERYLNRPQLIERVEARLGIDCFGVRAWKDTFSRDMRFIRSAFRQAGYRLVYSRTKGRQGYYLKGEGVLHEDIVQAIAGSVAEVDPAQIASYRKLTIAERFQQGCSITNLSHRVSKQAKQAHA